MGRKPDIPHFVGSKPVQTRRLPGRVPSTMAITNIDNHIPKSRHRGWSTHLASRRYRLAQPNRTSSRNFVTPGGIGTHTMHPARKRNHRDSNITHGNHKQFDTRGRAQRSARTRNASTGTSIRIGICQMDCGSFNARTSTRCRCAGGHSGPPLRGMHQREPAVVVECARYGSLLKSKTQNELS